jgi:hypothetical protein
LDKERWFAARLEDLFQIAYHHFEQTFRSLKDGILDLSGS